MMGFDTDFHSNFSTDLAEAHFLNLFQEITLLLTSVEVSVNILPKNYHVLTCFDIEAVFIQLDRLVSQIKKSDIKKAVECLVTLLHHKEEHSIG